MMDGGMEPEAAQQASATAGRAVSQMRTTARDLAAVLGRTAEALEQSAILAEQHAQRREQAGRPEAAAEERRAAERAHEAAARARARVEEWRKLLNEREI
jgi:hypothetical protein